jgi:hypothetical protein
MLPQTHFMFPFFAGLVLWKVGLWSWEFALLAGIIGAAVDIDHYIEHIIHAKKNRFSLIATWNNSVKLHRFSQRSFIHQADGMVILTIIFATLAYYNWMWALALSIGYYSHLLLDYTPLREGKRWRLKLGDVYINENSSEVIIDVLLLVGIIVVWFI